MARRPHEVTEITVTVRKTPTGYLLTQASCPGWGAHVSSPAALAHGMSAAFTEAQLAAYARWRGAPYDLALTEDDVPAAVAVHRQHPAERVELDEVAVQRQRTPSDRHDPAEWVPLPDGAWLSPRGHRYRQDTAIVASVVAARRERGLPDTA